MQVLFANVFLSPRITFVLEVPGAQQNGSLAAKGNINICLGNSDECLICFEGGSQRAGSRADHTP